MLHHDCKKVEPNEEVSNAFLAMNTHRLEQIVVLDRDEDVEGTNSQDLMHSMNDDGYNLDEIEGGYENVLAASHGARGWILHLLRNDDGSTPNNHRDRDGVAAVDTHNDAEVGTDTDDSVCDAAEFHVHVRDVYLL
jgi:hypothetical protein